MTDNGDDRPSDRPTDVWTIPDSIVKLKMMRLSMKFPNQTHIYFYYDFVLLLPGTGMRA